MPTIFESLTRIAGGLLLLAFGSALTYGMILMGMQARWEIATLHDYASYAFSTCFATAILLGGALIVVNPKIRGVRVW